MSSINASSVEPLPDVREQLFATLMANAQGGANAQFAASMLASWYTEEGVMPAYMGLTPDSYAAMMDRFFSGVVWPDMPARDEAWVDKMPEKAELETLFAEYARDEDVERQWIASMLIAGCIGHRHLWEDLGLFSRQDLSAMIAENFPELAIKNDRDMKWKKFIYKQLCEREGIVACPAPSCDACADFSDCFAPENEPSLTT
ncbi:MAG TPA: nitrogen fixation protein NifQ [Hyphomicrobiales bacterium]|nr:nitrogen fixation protein NifQ [Hyphomicrobiales bacterium]